MSEQLTLEIRCYKFTKPGYLIQSGHWWCSWNKLHIHKNNRWTYYLCGEKDCELNWKQWLTDGLGWSERAIVRLNKGNTDVLLRYC